MKSSGSVRRSEPGLKSMVLGLLSHTLETLRTTTPITVLLSEKWHNEPTHYSLRQVC